MSLPLSPFGRPTSSTVPASQNTAPVIKFRCLYTHDVRRKAKRWQDGYLKYHTFNKRAMVYDDAGNFIGDHHWRESHDIQDGDELELDKGVLIQVSECMETTQTDISVLFDKRKASQESPQSQKLSAPQLPPSLSNVSISSSYGRQPPLTRPVRPFNPLKPLNDVLGIQRGPIGRSVTPQSPYEQCHRPQRPVEHAQQEDERPTKRQKSTPVSNILKYKSTNDPVRNRPAVIDGDNPCYAKPPPKAVPVSRVTRDIEESTDSPRVPSKNARMLSVEQTPSREPRKAEGSKPTRDTTILPEITRTSVSDETSPRGQSKPEAPKPNNSARTPLDRPRDLSIERKSWKNQSKSVSMKPPTPAQDASNVQASSGRPQGLSEKPKSIINSNKIPMNPLRMSNEKPRPKLMYRALLPPKGPGEGQTKPKSVNLSKLKK